MNYCNGQMIKKEFVIKSVSCDNNSFSSEKVYVLIDSEGVEFRVVNLRENVAQKLNDFKMLTAKIKCNKTLTLSQVKVA